MTKLVLAFGICFYSQIIFCGNKISNDSLELIAEEYNELAEEYLFKDFDKALLFTHFAADCFLESGNIEKYLFTLSGILNSNIFSKNYSSYPIVNSWYINLIAEYNVKDSRIISSLYNSNAVYFRAIGNLDLAQEKIQDAIRILENEEDYYSLSICHYNLSMFLKEKKDYNRSSEELKIAINLLENIRTDSLNIVESRTLASYYFTIASIQLENKNLNDANENYYNCFEILKEIGDSILLNKHRNEYVYINIKYDAQKNAKEEISKVAEQSLLTYTDTLKYYSNKIQLGLDIETQSQLFLSMLDIIKKIDEPIDKQKEYLHFFGLQIEQFYCDSGSQMVSELDSIYSKHVFECLNFNISKKFDFLLKKMTQDVEREQCLNTNDFVFLKRYFNNILDNIQTEDSKYQLQKQIHQFQNLIFENFAMEDLPSSILFELFEFNKSLVLISELDKTHTRSYKSLGLKEGVIDQRRFLNHMKEELAILNAKDASQWTSIDSTISYNLKFELAKAKNDLDFLENQYFEKHPFEKHFADTVIIEPSQIQRSLKNNEVLIETFWSANALNFLLITDSNIDHFVLKNSEFDDFQNLISKLKVNNKSSELQRTFLQLSELLSLNDLNILNDKTKLIIVPDGPINNLPFELLYRNGNRLLNDYSISYQYSYKLLTVLQEQNSSMEIKNEFLGISFPTNETIASTERLCDDLELLKLSCAKNEVANIENILNLKNSQSDLTTNDFIKQSNEARIIHIASHACPDEENHQLSRIHFKDDFLTNYDISAMNLNADLAVLSACETGYGKVIEGEGAMTIARAFFHAGVKTNIVSLWKVDDCSTADLMNYFYQHLVAGEDSDVALKNAKLDFIENSHPQYHHPYYWAGFIHMGDTKPVFPKRYNAIHYLLGLCVFAIIGIALKKNMSSSKNAA